MKNQNISAFPFRNEIFKAEDEGRPCNVGLTKREHFAGLAMQGLLSQLSNDKALHAIVDTATQKGVNHSVVIATMSIELADELLKQLDKQE